MISLLQKLVSAVLIAAIAVAPVGASANTRASDSGPMVLPVSAAQVGTFPYSSWLIPDEDDTAALWQWVLGGTVGFALISAFISNDPDTVRERPNNGSNGAN